MGVANLITRRLFDVKEYYRLGEAGILYEDDRVELIEGEIVQKSPIGPRHAGCLKETTALFHQQLGRRYKIGVQDPLRLNEYSEPIPDLTILKLGKYRE